MRTSIKVTVSQPLPSMPPQMPYKNEPLKPDPYQKPEMPKIEPPPNRPPEEAPYIPNNRDQYKDEIFQKTDGIDFYLDGGRFFPENAAYSRVTIHGYSKGMKAFMKPVNANPDVTISRS